MSRRVHRQTTLLVALFGAYKGVAGMDVNNTEMNLAVNHASHTKFSAKQDLVLTQVVGNPCLQTNPRRNVIPLVRTRLALHELSNWIIQLGEFSLQNKRSKLRLSLVRGLQ